MEEFTANNEGRRNDNIRMSPFCASNEIMHLDSEHQ